MPIVYQNPLYPFQTSFGGVQAPSTQLNYRQMLSEVTSWNPDVDPMTAGRWINNYYRKIIDMRSWYGLKIKGQFSVPGLYQQGTVDVTNNVAVVVGTGTAWNRSMIGQQFRTGFTSAYQTIVDVPDATHLVLDTPYSSPTLVGSGYQMVLAYINFGGNIKRLLWAVNQQQGWPMICNTPVETINARDAWRTNLGWSKHLAIRSATPAGACIYECWPTPFQQQVFPFEAYQQPPDLVADSDSPVPWIASDLLVTRAVADALVYRGPRMNKYYDATTSRDKRMEFNERVESMANADNCMDQQDVSWDYEEGAMEDGEGSLFAQNHA